MTRAWERLIVSAFLMRRLWRYGEHLGQRQCPRRQTVWKVRLSEAVYIPMFFKINGEYIDFDRINLELNTMGDHGEEKIRWTQLALPIDILVLKRYNSGGSAETKEIHLRTLSGENKLWGNLWRSSEIRAGKILTKRQGVFFETYHFITGACGLTGRSGKFIHTPFLPKNKPHIFRRTSNEPRKQTQNLWKRLL